MLLLPLPLLPPQLLLLLLLLLRLQRRWQRPFDFPFIALVSLLIMRWQYAGSLRRLNSTHAARLWTGPASFCFVIDCRYTGAETSTLIQPQQHKPI